MNWILRNFHYNVKLSGWLPIVVVALVMGAFLVLFNATEATMIYVKRLIEVVIPLAFSLHAAFVFAPENEPAIEVLLSCPKPLSRLLGERLLTIGLLYGTLAFIATLLFLARWNAESLGPALARWLADGIVLAGVAVFTTQLTRQAAFGALMTTLLWASSVYSGDSLLALWPWAWPFHVYLQAEQATSFVYFLNRLYLLIGGIALILFAGILLRNDERSLDSK